MAGSWEQWVGQVVDGKFPLRQYLDGSDHSAVFLTEYGELEPKPAAIKLVAAEPAMAESLLTRWNLASQLSHPHLLRIFQTGRWQFAGKPAVFVVMEYAEENLAQILADRALTLAETRDMLDPVLETLAYLHGQGYVHGHLKPANILAAKDQLKLSSDGVCRIGKAEGRAKLSAYDPPERAGGADTSAGDVWSLGITLVEVLTQRRPVVGSGSDPSLPSDLSAPFDDIVRHCLRQDPQQRITVGEIAKQLRAPATGPTAVESRQIAARQRLIPVILVVGFALAVLVASPRWVHRRPIKEQPASSKTQPNSATNPARNVLPAPGDMTTARQERPNISAPRAKPSPGRLTSGITRPSEVPTATDASAQAGIVQQVMPKVSESARHTIEGTIRVAIRVYVDSSGKVSRAEFESPGPSQYFARAALRAAQEWQFTRLQQGSEADVREWILQFGFRRTETKVFPKQVAR